MKEYKKLKDQGRINLTPEYCDDVIDDIKKIGLKLTGYISALDAQSVMNFAHIVNMKQSEEKGYKDLKEITESIFDIAKLAKDISGFIYSIQNSMEHTSLQTRSSQDELSAMSEKINKGTKTLSDLQIMLEKMTSLSDSVRDNIKSLEDISARIDVLSINASIEAARAGSHGAGFKVVATEIKKLSLASKGLSKQITNELNDMDNHNGDVLGTMKTYNLEQKILTEKLKTGAQHWAECNNLIHGALSNVNSIGELIIDQNNNIETIKIKSEDLLKQNKQNLRASNLVEKSLHREESIIGNLTESNDILRKNLNNSTYNQQLKESDNRQSSIKVGHDLAYPPWVYLHQGVSTGLSIDYCNKIMDTSNTRMEFEAGQWSDLLDKLNTGKIDFIANVGWPNKALENGPYCVSDPYALFDVCYFQPQEWNKNQQNYSVYCQKGSFAADFISSEAESNGGEDNDILNFVQLIWNKTDRVITDRKVGEYISENYFSNQIIAEQKTQGTLDVVFLSHKRNRDKMEQLNQKIKIIGSMNQREGKTVNRSYTSEPLYIA